MREINYKGVIRLLSLILALSITVAPLAKAEGDDVTPPTITDVADAEVGNDAAATWEAPVTTAADDVSLELVITATYSTDDDEATVTNLAEARTHLQTVGNTVKVTYEVSDEAGNPATPVVAIFTSVATPPTVTFSPLTSATDVPVANNLTITFNEAIVLAADASEITDESVDVLITLKLTDADGEVVGFDATINAGKTVITINPTANLTNNQVYYVAIGATVEDAAGNNIAARSATFTTVAAAPSGGGGGGGGGTPAPYVAPLKSQAPITLTSSVDTIEFGGSFKVKALGGESTGALTYSSTGDALCAVDNSGNVTALGKGTCTITATKTGDSTYASATSNSVTVTVTDKTVAGVVPVEELIAPTLSISKPVAGTTTLRFKIDPIYSGDRVSVLLGTKVNGKTAYKTLGSATVSTSGAVTFKSKVKFNKGNLVRLKYGSTVIITKTV